MASGKFRKRDVLIRKAMLEFRSFYRIKCASKDMLPGMHTDARTTSGGHKASCNDKGGRFIGDPGVLFAHEPASEAFQRKSIYEPYNITRELFSNESDVKDYIK